MSKLHDAYLQLKKQDTSTIYLFKSGIFFIALDEDAHKLANMFDLKIGKLNNTVEKAGFPCNSYDKYSKLFKAHGLSVKLVNFDDSKSLSFTDYSTSQDFADVLDLINKVDPNNLSITEAYSFIEVLKDKVNELNFNK